MDDSPKPKDEETPEAPVEELKEEVPKEPQPENESEEKTEEPPKEEAPVEGTEEEKTADKSEEKLEKSEKQEESVKTEEIKERKKEIQKKKDHPDDFKYIVRLANTDIDGEKTLVRGLTSIKGVGMNISVLVVNETGIDKYAKMGDLKDSQIEKIQNALDNITKNAPSWMLNHRKDPETGEPRSRETGRTV